MIISLGIRKAYSFILLSLLTQTGIANNANGGSLPPPYTPGLGEIMNNNIQPHHLKLYFAGRSANWPLASYELTELEEAFQLVNQYQYNWNKLPIAKMQAVFMEPNFKLIEDAIKLKSVKKISDAYEKLTDGCNSCHKASAHSFIKIKTPTSSPFSNQELELNDR